MEGNSIIVRIDKDLEDLIPGYIENRKKDVSAIFNALKNSDFEAIRIIGHSMKGSGGGYGFDRITEIGKMIEDAAKAMDAEGIAAQNNELSLYLSRLKIVVE